MRVDDVAWQTLLAISQDVIQAKKRGFKLRVDDVASNVCQSLPRGGGQ
jgi:hypothetical protein